MKPALEGQTIPATAYMIFQAMFAALTPGNTIDKILDLAIKSFVCYTQLLLLDLQLSVCL
jgi:ammonia channel protein AmtB